MLMGVATLCRWSVKRRPLRLREQLETGEWSVAGACIFSMSKPGFGLAGFPRGPHALAVLPLFTGVSRAQMVSRAYLARPRDPRASVLARHRACHSGLSRAFLARSMDSRLGLARSSRGSRESFRRWFMGAVPVRFSRAGKEASRGSHWCFFCLETRGQGRSREGLSGFGTLDLSGKAGQAMPGIGGHGDGPAARKSLGRPGLLPGRGLVK
jgi:hypothetical protein